VKKIVGFLCVGVLTGVIVYAATYTHVQSSATYGYPIITWDTTAMAAQVKTDSFISDVVDISSIENASTAVVSYNLGTLVPCDSCNDSVVVYTLTRVKMISSPYWRQVDSTAILLGAANSRTVDEKLITHLLPKDSLQGTQMCFKTVVKDSCLSATSMNTGGIFVAQKTYFPLSIDVMLKK
jgi:hypothetical protein